MVMPVLPPPALGSSPEGESKAEISERIDSASSAGPNSHAQDTSPVLTRREFGAEAISSPSMPVVTTPTLPREVSGITPREATSREGTDMDFLSVSSPQDEDRVRKVGSQVSRGSRMIEDPQRIAFGKHHANSASLSSDHATEFRELNSPSAIADWIMRSQVFIYGIMFVILFNLVSLGIEVDIAAKVGQNDVPKYFDYMNLIVVIIFIMELAVNVTANGIYKFVCGGDWLWNIFDVIIVALSALETGTSFLASSPTGTSQVSPSHLRFMRPIRLARALRGVRVMRLFRYVGALRTLLLSDYCRDQAIVETGDLNASPECSNLTYSRLWSSVPEAMLTLFMAISGGIDWDDALIPLQEVSPVAVAALLLYIVITVFTVVNVVTGVFCNTAIESAAADKDIAVMKQMRKHAAQVQVLKNVFREIDEKSNKSITMEDLEEAMSAHKLSSFLQSMGIDTEDVMTLFQIIDSDGSGFIDVDEFVTGCMRLHGPAKSLDVAKMGFENQITKEAIKDVDDTLQIMKEQLSTLLQRQKMPVETNSSFAV